jgi:hypothetical protein
MTQDAPIPVFVPMTSRARTVLPTDLVALVSLDGRVYSNEAMTADRVGTQDSPHPLETAFEQWFSFATGRHTWISVKGPTLRGLISARKRGSKLAWEVDCLINAAEDDSGVLMSLLDQVTAAAGRSGALKVFLRLRSGSFTERAASRCEFAAYRRERVYRRSNADGRQHNAPEGLRRREKADLYKLFQLYNGVVPAPYRQIEAMTYAEWSAAQEHLGRTTHYVLERDGRVHGWLRVAGDGDIGRFDILGEQDVLDDLVEGALAKVANRATAYALIPEYDSALAGRLENAGFEPDDEFTVLCRRTVHVVKEPKPVPAIVHANLA